MKKEIRLARCTGIISLVLIAGVLAVCAYYAFVLLDWPPTADYSSFVIFFLLFPASMAALTLGIVSLVSFIRGLRVCHALRNNEEQIEPEQPEDAQAKSKLAPGIKAGILSLVFGSIALIYPILMLLHLNYLSNNFDIDLIFMHFFAWAGMILIFLIIPSSLAALLLGIRGRFKIPKGKLGRGHATIGMIIGVVTAAIIVMPVVLLLFIRLVT